MSTGTGLGTAFRRRMLGMVATAAVPALTLRNGVTIEDALATALELVARDSSYLKYDLARVAHDDALTIGASPCRGRVCQRGPHLDE